MGLQTLNTAVTACIGLYTFPIPSLLSTIWISFKIKSNKIWSHARERDNGSIILDMMTFHETTSTADDAPKTTIEQRMRQMLLDEQQFEDFVQFMIKEFSSESILSFVEFVQFKQRLIDYMNLKTMTTDDGKFENHLMSEGIPKSSIVHGNYAKIEEDEDMDKMFKNIATLLYEKYIKIGAEFEINISSGLRCQYFAINAKKWDMEIGKLVNVFDGLITEMNMFMRQSFCRYERSLQLA